MDNMRNARAKKDRSVVKAMFLRTTGALHVVVIRKYSQTQVRTRAYMNITVTINQTMRYIPTALWNSAWVS